MDAPNVALVMGAGRGMGREVACPLALECYEPAVAEVRACDETMAEIRARGGAARGYACDITDRSGGVAVGARRDSGPGRRRQRCRTPSHIVPRHRV